MSSIDNFLSWRKKYHSEEGPVADAPQLVRNIGTTCQRPHCGHFASLHTVKVIIGAASPMQGGGCAGQWGICTCPGWLGVVPNGVPSAETSKV